jgi:hypothetical protein
MPLLQKALTLFRRSRSGEPIITLPEPLTVVEDAPAPPPDNVIYIYSHGFTNGVYRVSPEQDSFQQFLEHGCHVDRIKELRELNESAIAETELKLQAAAAAHAVDTGLVVEKEKMAEHLSVSLAELEEQRREKVQREMELGTQIKECVSEHPWAPALFYLAAGITFIVADISITEQITSWGFDMKGAQSWIFAIGLAFTTFLIKPAVDRLLEKPFQAAGFKLKTVYKCVLLGLTIMSLIMLYCLGKFRADSEIAKNQLEDISNLMNNCIPGSPQYTQLQNRYDEIQKSLDNNVMGQTGLILSGMIFAIGGAICLSIAFGSLKHLINRYWILPARVRRLRKEAKVLDQKFPSIRSEYTATRTEQEKAERRLLANEVDSLKEELKKLQEERSGLLSSFYDAQCNKEQALYADGKNKGEKYEIEGRLMYKVSSDDQSSIYLGKQDAKNEPVTTPYPRAYSRRPFVKMRKMIADNYNKNQNSQSHDGSEFEIVS